MNAEAVKALLSVEGACSLLSIRNSSAPDMEPAATRHYSNHQLAALIVAHGARLVAEFTDDAA